MRDWTRVEWVDWHQNETQINLRLARFCRRHRVDVAMLLPGPIGPHIRRYYRAAIAHARHARSYAATGQPDRRGCSL